LTYYGGSTVIALNSDRYRDFFVESVPLGEAIIDYAEHNSWDKIQLTGLPKQGFEATKGVYRTVKGAVSRTIGISSYDSSPESPDVPKPSAGPVYPRKPTRPPVTFTQAEKKELDKPSPPNLHQEASSNSKPEINSIKPKGLQISKENEKLVAEVERILFEGKPISPSTPSSSSGDPPQSEKNVYSAPLPLGFEPPPGYTRPSSSKSTESVKSKNPEAAPSSTLPLISPAVKELAASEPVLAQIASSIDHLASLLRNSPSAPTSTSSPSEGAKDILDTAKADLVALGSRIEALKKEEQVKLEKKLKKQTDEYTSKLLQLEMDLQDKIDRQEEGFRALLEEERREIVSTYREKLAAELETQSEIINQRLVLINQPCGFSLHSHHL
jgi:mitofilin